MENRKLKNLELNDDALDTVSSGLKPITLGVDTGTELNDDLLGSITGGAFGDLEVCPVCGKQKREGMQCSWCDMAGGTATCHICGGKVTRESGCSGCGMSWDAYYEDTKWLRGE